MLTRKIYHVEIWLWILFFLFLSVIIFYIYIQYSAPNISKISIYQKKSLEHVLNIADSGDIILMAGDTRGERTCRWAAQSVFSHVGLLFREKHPVTNENVLYIWDCDLGQRSKDGVRVMPLRDKLLSYKGFRTAAIKKINKPLSSEEIVKLIPKYLSLKFDSRIITWWVANKNRDGGWLYRKNKNPKEIFCSELVASTLMDLGVISDDRVPAYYSPGDFERNNLNFIYGYSYGPLIYFDFPEDQVKKIIDKSKPISTGLDISSIEKIVGSMI